MALKTYKKLPVHIVEDHNEVLPSIYTAIGSKYLPLNNNCLVHLDSHPDLLAPKEMNSDTVWNKYELFSNLSIENWILPGCYSAQFNNIYWVKPPWSSQIPQGEYKIYVGSNNNRIRVDSNLYYFISDGLYANRDDLDNVKEVKLNVLEMSDNHMLDKLNEYLMKKNYYVLDIDLDFFSTCNPFSKIFKKGNLYDKLKSLYWFDIPEKLILDTPDSDELNQDELLSKITTNRNQQLEELDTVFKELASRRPVEDVTKDLIFVRKTSLKEVIKCVKEYYGQDQIDWEMVHTAGMTCDLSELPNHVSTEEELTVLFIKFEEFLRSLGKRPVLITIARSVNDDYTPSEQVSFIQENVLAVLKNMYGDLQIEKIYERSR